MGCKSPSEKTLAIFFALVFFEQEALFGDVEQTRRAFLDLKQDVKSLFKRLHGLYHCRTVECLPETPTQVDFFVMESIFKGQSWPAEPPIDVLQLRQRRPQCLCAQPTLSFDHMWIWLCKEVSTMASEQLAAPSFCFMHFFPTTCVLSVIFESCTASLWLRFLCVNDYCF